MSQTLTPEPPGLFGGAQAISVQQMSDLVQASSNTVRALANIAQILSLSFVNSSRPAQFAVYTVALLPTPTAIGQVAFASNGRNTGEGAAAGTGCLVQIQVKSAILTWCAVWSGVAVTA